MLISILLIFSGCPEFFTFNLFDGLDYVSVPTAEKLNEKPPAESITDLQEQLASDSFVQKIEAEEDQATVTAINDYLESIYTDTIGLETIYPDYTPAQIESLQTSAAVLAADLNLAVTGGDEFVNNVFDAFMAVQELNAGGGTGTEELEALQTILIGIIPTSITEAPTPEAQLAAFTELLTGIMAAGEIYTVLGNTIITDPTQGAAVYEDVTGGVVMNALVTGLITEAINTFLLPGYQTPEAAANVFWQLYNGGPEAIPNIVGLNTSADFSNALSNLSYLENIALASGADLTALLNQTPVAP